MNCLPSLTIDTAFVSRLKEQLSRELVGGRIQKVQMPHKDLILLTIRKDGENHKVLISCTPGKGRVHLTSKTYENPPEPLMLCMLLRKHLSGAEIREITQAEDDRIIFFQLSNADDLGRSFQETLAVEMLGRCPNAVLTDDSGHIVDCVHRRTGRNPGLIYRLPEKMENQRSNPVPEGDLSSLLDEYYTQKEQTEILHSKAKQLRTGITSAIHRTERKLASRMMEMERTKTRDTIRKRADLITANLYRIRKGDTVLICEDFYNDNARVEISLDEHCAPSKQAEKLYREYNKLKKAETYLKDLICEAEDQLYFLQSEQDLLSRASSEEEMEQIREELEQAGFFRQSKAKKGKKKQAPGYKVMKSPSGLDILVGRNQKENMAITFREADRDDFWFHARNYHGSHVVLRCSRKQVTENDLLCAAQIAAECSQADGECVVDYTKVANVQKIHGALPGHVTYTNYLSISVSG